MKKQMFLILPIALLLMGASCSVQQPVSTNQPGTPAQPAVPAQPATNQPAVPAQPARPPVTKPNPLLPTVTVNTGPNVKLGTILTAANGMTLYTFTNDTTGSSSCTGACSIKWPAYTVSADTKLFGGLGVSASALSTITLANGNHQVSYNGKPLYFYTGDVKPGDANGQDYSHVWFAAKP